MLEFITADPYNEQKYKTTQEKVNHRTCTIVGGEDVVDVDQYKMKA